MAAQFTDDDPLVPEPTYMGYIRNCFTDDDVEHMAKKGIDLSTYDGVKNLAANIYIQTLQPDGPMPKDDPPPAPPRRKWSANRSANFKTWIINKCPLGVAASGAQNRVVAAATSVRLRKNINNLADDEKELLKKAFAGIIAFDVSEPDNPNSYFNQAAVHGLPRMKCMHHRDQYNPWHRVFITKFEDALRSVKGCESVTLPYWDITTPVPALLNEPPFDKYTVAKPLGGPFPTPYVTSRFDAERVQSGIVGFAIPSAIQNALKQSMWGTFDTTGFQHFIIAAHDNGHAAIGSTMQVQEVAAFDPIFWFFHCNWERLFKSWQAIVGASDLKGFKSTLTGDTSWLTFPPLDPWADTPDQTVEQTSIDYEQLSTAASIAGVSTMEHRVGSIDAAQSFSMRASGQVSVRIKDINRLAIPGTFIVHLIANGESVAKQAFFQPNEPNACDNCREHGLVSINLLVAQKLLEGRKLSVKIEVPAQEEFGAEFPLSRVGNPTLNARLLLEEA
jgi:hypothetical protein